MTDPQLIDRLTECKDLHLVLSNDNDEKEQNKKKLVIYDGKNQPGVKKLKNAKEIIRRYMPSGHIGHNKFFVYCDKAGNAKAVLTGSTNWTASGLCTESNNAILIEDDRLAADYLQYWKDLKTDALAAEVRSGRSDRRKSGPDTAHCLRHAARPPPAKEQINHHRLVFAQYPRGDEVGELKPRRQPRWTCSGSMT